MRLTLLLLGILSGGVNGFVPSRPLIGSFCRSTTTSRYVVDRSRLEGNQREPTPQELAVMDEMIEKLADAKPYELPNAVRRAFRVCSSPQFFMRIAEAADKAVTSDEKEKLSALASNLVACLDAVVSTTEDQLDERAKEVEKVVKAAAEPDSGEFLVPLSIARIEAMRQAIKKLEPSSLDEGFLATLDAWSNKSFEDGMDGMVTILQKVLQLYAGLQMKRQREIVRGQAETTPVAEVFDILLDVDSDSWENAARQEMKEKDIKTSALVSEIQRTMETIVLNLDTGSMAQRIQAEYLKEMVSRVENIEN